MVDRITPFIGLEPITPRLTAECSAIELKRLIKLPVGFEPTTYALLVEKTRLELIPYTFGDCYYDIDIKCQLSLMVYVLPLNYFSKCVALPTEPWKLDNTNKFTAHMLSPIYAATKLVLCNDFDGT